MTKHCRKPEIFQDWSSISQEPMMVPFRCCVVSLLPCFAKFEMIIGKLQSFNLDPQFSNFNRNEYHQNAISQS
jgi:hypothetical protein